MYCIFTYIYHKNQLNVGKYTSPIDGMGSDLAVGTFPARCGRSFGRRYFHREGSTHLRHTYGIPCGETCKTSTWVKAFGRFVNVLLPLLYRFYDVL